MKILFISNVPLKKENSLGNSLLNLFGDIKEISLASIFTRAGEPDVEITHAFCITEVMLIKNLLKGGNVGKKVHPAGKNTKIQHTVRERSIINFMKARRWTIFFWMQNLVWKIGRWKSTELENYVKEYNPDIILTVLSNSVYLNDLILHVHSLSNTKLVLYAWDNNYSLRRFILSPLRWIKHFIDRASMRKLASKADLFYVISEIQKKDYEKSFHKTCAVLTKGADFSEPPAFKGQYNTPLQLVFTGNIALNRWKSLKLIADALENINKDGILAQLRIYTATPITKKMDKALNRGESSFLMGSVPSCEVAGIQEKADVLVHVEALDLKNKLTVRQSFSTKIVDYLKAARPILAVGPKDVASIDHLIRNDCAIVASNGKELEDKLRAILSNESELNRIAQNAYECGRRHHYKQDIQTMLMNDLREVCGK